MGEKKIQDPNELPEQSGTPEKKTGLAGWIDSIDSRSTLIMVVAGGYVAYLGWGLCKGFVTGEEGTNAGFFAAGAAFLVIGLFLVAVGGWAAIKAQNKKKLEEGEETSKAGASEKAPAEKKSMSIAERAALANQSEEPAAEEDLPDEDHPEE